MLAIAELTPKRRPADRLRAVSYFSLQSYCTRNPSTRLEKRRTASSLTGRGRKSLSSSVGDNCRLYVKIGSQGNQIWIENLFQPSKQAFDVILAFESCKCESVGLPVEYPKDEDKSDRIFSCCERKIKTLHQLCSFVSSALFISEKEKDESANVGFFARLNSTGKKNSETCTWQCSCEAWPSRRTRERVGSCWSKT